MIINLRNKNNIAYFKKNILTKLYDFIVIGSGPASITLINELLNKDYSILILEKGDFNQNRFEVVSYKKLPIKLKSRIFSIGGTSNSWAGISSYMEDFEMKSRYANKYKNLWPLKNLELKKYYNKLNKDYGFNYKSLKKFNYSEIPFQIRKFTYLEKPVNFKDHIQYDKIDIICNCEVLTVDESKHGEVANFRINNNNFSLIAKKLIICAGGIESTRLVLNSLKKKKLKYIKNKKLIGRYFMDHPKFILGYLKYPKYNLIKNYILKDSCYYGISLKKNIQKKFNILNSYVKFELVNNYFNFKKNFFNLNKILDFFFKKIFKSFNFNSCYRLKVFCEMHPNIKNQISIINKNSKVLINYNLSKIDVKTLNILRDQLYNYFSYFPQKEKKNQFTQSFFKRNIKDASHHMGGLIYSINKNRSVVDKNLKLIGTNNIYVCSSAVFPTSGSANPTMTICALAVRLANYLVK